MDSQYIIDSGFIFKLKCLTTGRFQAKSWEECRKRKYCKKTPPYPPVDSGLIRYNPYQYKPNKTWWVPEFDYAVYPCEDKSKVKCKWFHFSHCNVKSNMKPKSTLKCGHLQVQYLRVLSTILKILSVRINFKSQFQSDDLPQALKHIKIASKLTSNVTILANIVLAGEYTPSW